MRKTHIITFAVKTSTWGWTSNDVRLYWVCSDVDYQEGKFPSHNILEKSKVEDTKVVCHYLQDDESYATRSLTSSSEQAQRIP